MNTYDTILASAAILFDLTPADLTGPRKIRRFAHARHAVAWVLWQRGYGTTEIGELLRRDHSTIGKSIEAAEKLADAMPEYAAKLRALLAASAGVLHTPEPPTVRGVIAGRTYTIKDPLRLTLAFWGLSEPLTA